MGQALKIAVLAIIFGAVGGALITSIVLNFLYPEALKSEDEKLAYAHLVSKPLAETSSYQLLGRMAASDPSLVIVDVRNKDAYNLGHIKGAISMPFEEMKTRYNELPKNKDLVVYCWSKECMLGPTAAAFLATRGILSKELRIGWCEWSERGYPIDGNRYILAGECSEPQRKINNESIEVISNLK